MPDGQVFQPFTDRLSRDIRNALSKSFVTVLQQRTIDAAQTIADYYLQKTEKSCYRDYIRKRLQCYKNVLVQLDDKDHEPLLLGLILWDEKLFFEVHEVLEHVWLDAKGEEKLFLQAMIRAAGVYIKLEAGYSDPASRMAGKAIPVLERNQHRLALYTNPAVLIKALRTLEPSAPILLSPGPHQSHVNY
ncbi:MAG: DUF309 domain-containing protein [Desulfopila sp.]|jgi:hypothetical protein|nr:DUF309 domain-containing protein [Desulfopila sp.]